MPHRIAVTIRAKHIKNSTLNDLENCPVARAMRDQFETTDVKVSQNAVLLKGYSYKILGGNYTLDAFEQDQEMCEIADSPNDVLRVFTIEKY
jgi:hypothetical protein